MCLLVFAWQSHPRYPLVFVGNRDEFHARPTAPAGWWDDAPLLLAGRDLQAGGTWAGVTRDGRFAVVTNFREPEARDPAALSRGKLVTDFLVNGQTAEAAARELDRTGAKYAGYNLLFTDGHTAGYHSNRAEARTPLPPGIYGLSNHVLDTPWPKLRRVKRAFTDSLEPRAVREPDVEALMAPLADRRPAEDGDLPDTGIPEEWERLLSSPFIVSPEYGTRATTAVLVDSDRRVTFRERSFDPDGRVTTEIREAFDMAPTPSPAETRP